jgi:predicted metal-dependent enzyme (double-stranded beta helix superfamily)
MRGNLWRQSISRRVRSCHDGNCFRLRAKLIPDVVSYRLHLGLYLMCHIIREAEEQAGEFIMSRTTTTRPNDYDPGIVERRRKCVAETVATVRRLESEHGVTRSGLERIELELIKLSKHKELFSVEHFPNPEPGGSARLYLLSEDAEGRFPLYLTCALPGGTVRPHNHGTWAVVAGLSGCEENTLYERVAGGGEPGMAEIAQSKSVRLHDGESIALLPDDIHSVATPGDVPRRHFHMYGLSLECLPKRLAYDMKSNSCAYMEINPKIVRLEHA